MSDQLNEIIANERARIAEHLAEVDNAQALIDSRRAAVMNEMRALEMYVAVRDGRISAPTWLSRRPKGSLLSAVIDLASERPMTSGEMRREFEAKGDHAAARSIYGMLLYAVRSGRLVKNDRLYQLAPRKAEAA